MDHPVGWERDRPATMGPVMDLLEILTLEAVGADRFLAHSPQEPRPRVFGGQVVAQALAAASATVPAGHLAHSLHTHFLRGGDVARPIELEVERLREGRAFSARRVTARQEGRVILVLSGSHKVPADGGDFQVAAPPGVPDPEHLPHTRFSNPARIEARDASFDQPHGPGRRLWFRSAVPLPDDGAVHRAAIAYATDHGPFGAARRVVDASGTDFDGLFTTSLDHAIWFHRAARADEWLLYDVEAVAHHDERVLTRAAIYDRAGRRVASVNQEILARSR
jgi:acyl-CoA thioesterase II